jgi:hypothetical protein
MYHDSDSSVAFLSHTRQFTLRNNSIPAIATSYRSMMKRKRFSDKSLSSSDESGSADTRPAKKKNAPAALSVSDVV